MIRTLRLLALAVLLSATFSTAAAEPNLGDAVELFNGKNLEGWGYFLVEPDVKMKDVWSVKDGILICQGEPMGYLATDKEYKDFRLVVEWRWAPGKDPGNSGVLMRITGEPKALPKCVEAQLKHGNAGDIWAFQGFSLKGDPDRFVQKHSDKIGDFVGVGRIAGNEKKPGEWNEFSITLDGGELSVALNGKLVNKAARCDDLAGKIGLQSEGGEIHFRTVKLVPILK
ncbi:MAG: DUF1080 domain-containing protein [Pirellulales bacterium]|nr:DUF1080 domain-containing protein [Pirellulales bacterium]